MAELVVALVVYLAIVTAVSIYSRLYARTGDPVDYFIASRGLSGFTSAMTYAATTYSAFMMVGLVGLSYATGVGALAFELAYLISTVAILATLGTKVWELSRGRGYVTPTQLLRDRLGSHWATVVAVVLTAVALIPYSSVQMVGPASIIAGIGGGSVDYRVAVTIAFAVTLVTTLVAGVRSVAWSDAVQGFIMLTSALAFIVWLATRTPPEAVARLADAELLSPLNRFWTPYTFFAYTTPWIFFAITNPQVFQRLYLPRSRRDYVRMVVYFAVFGLLYTVITVLVGLLARGLVELGTLSLGVDLRDRSTWNRVTPSLLNYTHPALAVAVAVSILAAATSTINSIVLTIASMVSYDTVIPERYRLAVGKAMVVLFSLVVYLFALSTPAFVVDLAVASSTLLLPLLPLYLFSVYGLTSRYAYLSTLAVGFPLALGLTYAKGLQLPVPKEVVVAVASVTTYLAVALLERAVVGRRS
ncbi:MAG: sodium:solute symporter family protein [Desulfurococcaceae archaeon]|nr:sodium:solute symporter family protein [Desulfurococcaceae archaeon]